MGAGSILAGVVITFLLLWAFRLVSPIGRWTTSMDQSPSQLLFNLRARQNINIEREDDVHLHCLVEQPNGRVVEISVPLILDIARHSAVFFFFPQDFSSGDISTGRYNVRWFWEEHSRPRFQIAQETYEVVAPTSPDGQ